MESGKQSLVHRLKFVVVEIGSILFDPFQVGYVERNLNVGNMNAIAYAMMDRVCQQWRKNHQIILSPVVKFVTFRENYAHTLVLRNAIPAKLVPQFHAKSLSPFNALGNIGFLSVSTVTSKRRSIEVECLRGGPEDREDKPQRELSCDEQCLQEARLRELEEAFGIRYHELDLC